MTFLSTYRNVFFLHISIQKRIIRLCIFVKCFLDWTFVAEKKSCVGFNNKLLGRLLTLDECAKGCRDKAAMFAYGTNVYGDRLSCNRHRGGCFCICQTLTIGGKCIREKNDLGYRLYRNENVNKGI